MQVELHTRTGNTRPCRFSLCLQGGSVFADFDVDPNGLVYAVRVSFDSFGCCGCAFDIGRMGLEDSTRLLAMVARRSIEVPEAAAILRAYFAQNLRFISPAALRAHDLV